jgi:hypothetical protein
MYVSEESAASSFRICNRVFMMEGGDVTSWKWTHFAAESDLFQRLFFISEWVMETAVEYIPKPRMTVGEKPVLSDRRKFIG